MYVCLAGVKGVIASYRRDLGMAQGVSAAMSGSNVSNVAAGNGQAIGAGKGAAAQGNSLET